MPSSVVRRLLCFILLPVLIGSWNGTRGRPAAEDPPPYFFPLAAPWPAGVVLHGGKEGYGYGPGPTHRGTDVYAMDFNGVPGNENPVVETADRDLLVLAVADGCLKEVKEHPGYYNKDGAWQGNYGWSVVILHPGGYQSRYAHLKATPLVPLMSYVPGECYFVSQGQPIGQVGGTGTENDAAVHLHLTLYYCKKPGNNCTVSAVKPEPLDGVKDLPSGLGTSVRVTSQNYSVGYKEITGNALTNPASLIFHKPIWNEYQRWGGQYGFFGRAKGGVTQLEGTNIFFQEFMSHPLQSFITGTIVEVNSQAYFLPTPIWDSYRNNYLKYGNPNAAAYVAGMGDEGTGWRVDFQKASLFWNGNLSEPIVWDEGNAPWKVMFCPGTNNFGCNPIRRRDPAADFSFFDSNNPGPLTNTQGFSMLIEASFAENLVSKISLEYEIQGNARFYIDSSYQGDWIQSEDGVIQGVTAPKWHIGNNIFAMRFWQSPGKRAHLKLQIHEKDIGIPTVHAFESQGSLVSSAFQSSQPEYIDFEPPPYPGDPGAAAVPPTEPPSDIPGTPPFEMPDIAAWWDNLVKNIQDRIDQWWQDLTKYSVN